MKYEVAGSKAWAKLENADQASLCRALMNVPEFWDKMPSRTRYSTPNKNPVKHLCCPKGHEIIRLQLVVDVPMLSTGGEDHAMVWLEQPGDRERNSVPADQVLISSDRDDWGVDEWDKVVWTCAYSSPAGVDLECEVQIPWGSVFCDEHRDEPMPDRWNEVQKERIRIRCPQGGCNYNGTHKRGGLVVLYATAVVRPTRQMKLEV